MIGCFPLANTRLAAWLSRGWLDRRSAAAVEFALVGGPFIFIMLFVVEISADLYEQESLDTGLHQAVRMLQTGNAQNVLNGSTFVSTYLCPNTILLSCSSLYINVQSLTLNVGTVPTQYSYIPQGGYTDFYNYTTGTLPMANGQLNLSSFASAQFCNAAPSETLLVTAIYVGPTIIGNMLPNVLSVSYNGSLVHAVMSQVGTVAENFTVTTATGQAAASC
jgi:hypothetical protein